MAYAELNCAETAIPRRSSSDQDGTTVGTDVVDIPLGVLQCRPLYRRAGVDPGHVRLLAEVRADWPPILVHAPSMLVIDGQHRVAAAQLLHLTHVRGRLFKGSDDDAFARGVALNVRHGLPLSREERSDAVRKLLMADASRSDRAVARLCGVDHKTVARVRGEMAETLASTSKVRLGLDGRLRPTNRAEVRARIAEALSDEPHASLRAIAAKVGAAPETVRSVKAQQIGRAAFDGDRTDTNARDGVGASEDGGKGLFRLPNVNRRTPSLSLWVEDTACGPGTNAAGFADWFDGACVVRDWPQYVEAVPLSRVYEVADQARAYAAAVVGVCCCA